MFLLIRSFTLDNNEPMTSCEHSGSRFKIPRELLPSKFFSFADGKYT